MSEQELIQVAKDVVDAFNGNDWEGCKACLTQDSVYDEVGTSRRIQGANEIISTMQDWKGAMPDVKGTISNIVATGNTVVVELTWHGTHTGLLQSPSGEIPATGKTQTTRAGWVQIFDGNKIKESRHYFDMLSFMAQLGLLPE